MGFQETAPALDELLLDLAAVIELSDHDRQVAENRYYRLKDHLERPSSSLRQYLLNSSSLIYAQGSMSIGATILSGTNDDRFDVDALVEMEVPNDWAPEKAMDELEEALQGFPGVKKIVRCTRCVQLQFAFMHMDVTILDPAAEPRDERVGEIFHSPDEGESYRVPSNPYGFSQWYRSNVVLPSRVFTEELAKRRGTHGVDRLQEDTAELVARSVVEASEQEDLPVVVPPRLDAQQVVALKLIKRFLNLQYDGEKVKRPPSIYVTKLSQTCGYTEQGLTAQLERLAAKIEAEMNVALAAEQGPDERNPSYKPDCLNDRWPKTQQERKLLADHMAYLQRRLAEARDEEFASIAAILSDLFGEDVSSRTVKKFMERHDQRLETKSGFYELGTGAVIASPAIAAPAVARSPSPAPRQNFHAGEIPEAK